MQIETFTTTHRLWPAYLAHLEQHQMRRWVINDQGQPNHDTYFLGCAAGEVVVGHLSLKRQPIVIPATAWNNNQEHPLLDATNAPRCEAFVQTFAVDEAQRRQGIGTALQRAGLALARELGCYQMRSWSSLDKLANYALKLKLGFAVHPAIFETGSGQRISGAYFIRPVHQPENVADG